MKLNLNEVVTDLEGNAITRYEFIDGETKEIPIKFGNLLYHLCLRKRTKTDEEASFYYSLMQKLFDTADEVELTDDEIKACKELLSNQSVAVKGKFLEMASENE